MRISKARKLFGESRRLTSLQLCVSFIFETCKYFDPLFKTVTQCVRSLFEVANFNYSRYFFSYLNQTFNRLRKQLETISSNLSGLKKIQMWLHRAFCLFACFCYKCTLNYQEHLFLQKRVLGCILEIDRSYIFKLGKKYDSIFLFYWIWVEHF